MKKSIEEYFIREQEKQEEFKGPVTRKRFREELIRLVFNMISSTVFEDFYDRKRYVDLLDLLLEGKSYEDFVLSTRESYFIDSVALMENRVRRGFEHPMWHFGFCKRDSTCSCFYKMKKM